MHTGNNGKAAAVKVTQEKEMSKESREQEMSHEQEMLGTQRSREETEGDNDGNSNREHVGGNIITFADLLCIPPSLECVSVTSCRCYQPCS